MILLFFNKVKRREFHIIISEIVHRELIKAPDRVKNIPVSIPDDFIEIYSITEDIEALAQEYIKNGILTNKWIDDALHIATATCARADAIISWNFKHIVRFDKIKLFNQVNIQNNYAPIAVYSPMELVYEKEE